MLPARVDGTTHTGGPGSVSQTSPFVHAGEHRVGIGRARSAKRELADEPAGRGVDVEVREDPDLRADGLLDVEEEEVRARRERLSFRCPST